MRGPRRDPSALASVPGRMVKPFAERRNTGRVKTDSRGSREQGKNHEFVSAVLGMRYG